ncbi:hypothetical protein AB1N83_002347 [Pleurotus pulmonarius]
MMAALGSVMAAGSSVNNTSIEMPSDVDSLFGDSASEVDSLLVSSVQGLSTSSMETTPPVYVNPKHVVEVVIPPQLAWVDEHLAEKQSVVKHGKVTGPAGASGSLVETLATAFSNNAVQPTPSPSPFKKTSLSTSRVDRKGIQQVASLFSPPTSPLFSPSSCSTSSLHDSPLFSPRQEPGPSSPSLQKETETDENQALWRKKTQFVTNTVVGRSTYQAPPEMQGRRGSKSSSKRSIDSGTPVTTAGREGSDWASAHDHASGLVGSDILGIVANLRHLAKAHGEYKLATTQPETRAMREITTSRTNVPEVERRRLGEARSVTGERSGRLPSRPSQSTTAAFVDRLEDMFGPGSILRGSGPRPSNKEPKHRSVGISRPARSNTDTDTDSTISDTPVRRQDKVRARDQDAESSTPEGPKPKRRRVEEVSIGSQAEGKLIKGKSRLRQEELMSIRQVMDTIQESWMTKKLRFSLVKDSGLLSSIRHLATLTSSEIGYGDEHGLVAKGQALVALFSD